MSSSGKQIKLELYCRDDGDASSAENLNIGVEAVGNMGTELLGDCAAGQADVCQKEEEVQHEEGNIGITVMEQDTNGAMVMVLRSEQFCTSSDVSDHPATGAGVSKRQDDVQVPTQLQEVSSQADKSAGLCENGFTSGEEIVQEDVKPYLCGVCDMCFTDISDLNKHTRQHTEEEPYIDDAGITHDSDVKDENTQSEETAYKCHVCGLEFTNSKFLAQHEKRHSEGDACKRCDCGLKLNNCKCLKAESLDTSGDGDERATDHSALPAQQTPSAGDKRYSCDSCGLRLMCFSDLKSHKRIHTSDAGDLERTSKSQMEIYARTHTGNTFYKCDSCDLGFKFKSALDKHKRVHTVEKPFKCDVCDIRFAYNGCLRKHQQSHTEDNANKCDICHVEFTPSSYLAVHKRMHTGERPYVCNVCGLKFTVKSCLVRHTRIHTGERPYKCDICQKTFAANFNLNKHIRVHTGERPYRCDVCGQEFTCSSHLKRHSVVHTGEKPYKCDVCNVRFPFQSYLKVHKIIHTGERPYKCDICGIRFAYQSYLTVHKRKHAEEKL